MFSNKLIHYIKSPPRDNRSRFAGTMDFIMSLSLIWVLTFMVMQYFYPGQEIPPALVLPVMAAEAGLVTWRKVHKHKKLRLHKNIWYSAKKCHDNFKKMTSKNEFAIFCRDLMQKTAPFEELKISNNTHTPSIDLSGLVHGHKVGIMCINPDQDELGIGAGQIKKFLQEIKELECGKGIVITTSFFSDDARRFVHRNREKISMHLIDRYTLLRMAKQSNHPIFPDEKWQDEMENRLTGREMAMTIKDSITGSRRKALIFSLLGFILLIITTQQTGFIGLVYLIFGIVNLFIGFTGLIISFIRKDDTLFNET